MNDEKFKYKYKALNVEEQKEVASIKSQYEALEQNKDLVRLKTLDRRVKQVPTILSIVVGSIGLCVFGLGMTCTLEWDMLVVGILLCFIGAVFMIFAYVLYQPILNRLKRKYKDEILELSNKLLEE